MTTQARRSQRALAARAGDAEHSVLVHEVMDPSGDSLEWLRHRGVRVATGVLAWGDAFLSEDELIERGRGYTALMGASTHPITARVLESLPDVAYISKYGIGVDSIDMDAANRLGVLVTNTPIPDNWEVVAEYAIASMLALSKQFLFYTNERMRQGGWRSETAWARCVRGRTVGLVGYGRVGRGVARRLGAWGCKIIVSDPYIDAAAEGVDVVPFEVLLREADIISLHAVATEETRHMIDVGALAVVKPGAILINSARGALVDLDAVADAVESGRLAGVAIDAYESEPPPPEHRIFGLPNVIATPHASAWVKETFEAVAQTGAENLWEALSGATPRFAVNGDVLGVRRA